MPEVVIVGGGVIGCATAYYLARAGASVTVLERGEVAGEASGASAGMLAALSDEGHRPPLFTELCDESLALYDSLLPDLATTGIDVRHRRIDILHLALDDAQAEALREFHRRKQRETEAYWLKTDEVLEVEPAANPKAVAGVLAPGAQYVDARALTQALAEAARRRGAAVREHEGARRLLPRGGRLGAVRTETDSYEADAFVLAGGPWTLDLARRLGAHVPVRPVRGQMLSLDGPPGGLRTMIWGPAYLIPREEGQTYVGATVEEAGFRKHTTMAGLRGLRSGAEALVPALRTAPQRRAWAGLRPAAPDDLPIMGLLPGWENVWVSTGHFRNGVLLAPLSGRLIAQSVLAGRPADKLAQLSPGRFAE